MAELKEYRVKVTEKHCGYVWIKAKSREEAKDKAPETAECDYESLYDCEIMEENEL